MNKTEMKEKIQDLESQLQELKHALEDTDQEIPKGQLCWFWDMNIHNRLLNLYGAFNYDPIRQRHPHTDYRNNAWKHAKPVTPEEIRKMMPMFPEMQSTQRTLFDWSEIPEGYNYAAIDADGNRYAYGREPFWNEEKGQWMRGGQYNYLKDLPNPENSLEKRPGV